MIYLITDRCDPHDEKETLKCAICIDLKFYKNKTKQQRQMSWSRSTRHMWRDANISWKGDSLSKTNEFNVCWGAVIKDKGIWNKYINLNQNIDNCKKPESPLIWSSTEYQEKRGSISCVLMSLSLFHKCHFLNHLSFQHVKVYVQARNRYNKKVHCVKHNSKDYCRQMSK